MKAVPAVVGCVLFSLTWVVPLHADRRFHAILTGAQQVPAVASNGTGVGTVVLNTAETQIKVNMSFAGLTSNATMAHIHGTAAVGSNAGVLFDFSSVTPNATSGSIPEQTFAITAAQVTNLKAGRFYFNIHTGNFGGGEIRGQILAAPHEKFTAALTGAQEVPPVAGNGTGNGMVQLNATETQILVDMSFSGLSSNADAAHIHGPAAPGVTAGVLFDLSGVTPAATSGTIPRQTFAITEAQVAQLRAGQLYFNIHTANFSDGEIRGQIGPPPARKFVASLDGDQEVPSVSSPGTGTGTVLLNEAGDEITVNLTFSGLTSNAVMAHIHGPATVGANAGILFDFTTVTPAANSGTIPAQTFAITPAQVAQLESGQLYFNIHTGNFGGGEIRGQLLHAPIRRYSASMTGAQEVPPTGSGATGSGKVVLNELEDQIAANGSFSSLTTNATMAHIHGPAAAGVSAGILFPLDGIGPVTTGIIADQLHSISPAQVTQLKSGLHYFNVHTGTHSGGEIRGQIGADPLLTVARGGTGSSSTAITSGPSGIMCGGDCIEAYPAGTTVTLTPGTAAAGSFFAGWTGGGCMGLTCSAVLNADTTVTAIYTLSSTPFTFTDDPLVPQGTRIKAVHITQLRSTINTLRTNNGLAAFAFTDPALAAGSMVKAVHFAELRTALAAVYTQRSRPVPTYTDPALTVAMTSVKGLHIAELRSAVRLIE